MEHPPYTPTTPQHYRVFVASPADVRDERLAIYEIAQRLPYDPAFRGRVTIEVVAWDGPYSPVPLLASVDPQQAVLIGLPTPSECDLVIVVLHGRLGTALAGHFATDLGRPSVTGTEWEYHDALRANIKFGRPEILVYRKTTGVLIPTGGVDGLDEARRQLGLVEGFFGEMADEGRGWNTYRSIAGFKRLFSEHLPAVLERSLRDSRTFGGLSPTALFFLSRFDAEPNMKRDMLTASRLVFLGISNVSLSAYIEEVIGLLKDGEALPWKHLHVHFASQAIGETWEGGAFNENRTKAILAVWEALRRAYMEGCLPHLVAVTFWISHDSGYFSGSLFRRPEDEHLAEFKYPIIYVVFAVPAPKADAKSSSTLRLTSAGTAKAREFHETYNRAYLNIVNTSRILAQCEIGDVWDNSADAWYNFQCRYDVYRKAMKRLIEWAGIASTQHVLDVGCATGQASVPLANRVADGSLTLLDSSPEMIRMAQTQEDLCEHGNVRFVVTDVRTELDLAPRGSGFDVVVLHFSLQWMIRPDFSLSDLAAVLNRVLTSDGEVLIAVHNSVLSDDEFLFAEDWVDPLRVSLRARATDHGFIVREADATPRLSETEIFGAFTNAGFALSGRTVESFERTMADRVQMWRVPAVLDSFLEVHGHGVEQINELLDCVLDDVCGSVPRTTPPTKVLYLKFRKYQSATADARSW